jgi:Domain of unknown function (DUF5615)
VQSTALLSPVRDVAVVAASPARWRKRKLRAEDARRFVATFEGKAKFLVDESFGVEAARVIRDLGWDAELVCDVGLGGRPDEDVMAYAQPRPTDGA